MVDGLAAPYVLALVLISILRLADNAAAATKPAAKPSAEASTKASESHGVRAVVAVGLFGIAQTEAVAQLFSTEVAWRPRPTTSLLSSHSLLISKGAKGWACLAGLVELRRWLAADLLAHAIAQRPDILLAGRGRRVQRLAEVLFNVGDYRPAGGSNRLAFTTARPVDVLLGELQPRVLRLDQVDFCHPGAMLCRV